MTTNKIEYVIAIDAGGSKTKACLTCLATSENWDLKVGAASLSHDLVLACERIKGIADSLIHQAKVTSDSCIIVCGAAGAGCVENANTLSDYLKKDYPQNTIVSDAQTSLFGAGNGEPILVVAVGTGSVAMRLDENGNEKMFGGWGFVAGDLGSGADMGKQLIARLLVQFDKASNSLEPLLQNALESLQLSEVNRQGLLNWLKKATPTHFAAIAPLLFEYKESETANKIIETAAKSVDELIAISQPEKKLPVAIIGGLSHVIKPYLSLESPKYLIEAKGDALDGALFLAKQELIKG